MIVDSPRRVAMAETPAADRHADSVSDGNYFVAAYPPFACWRDTGLPAFRRVLAEHPRDAASLLLYVHVPFCAARCPFCYYLAYDSEAGEIDGYLEALACELRMYSETPFLTGRPIDVVYIGGGTPSLLSDKRLVRLLSSLQAAAPWSHAREVTFECAPKSVTPDKMTILRDFGVTRLSLGVQSFDDRLLDTNGRIHLRSDALRAYDAIRATDFPVVNVDLMVGLVGETDESCSASVSRAIELAPESVTVYQMETPAYTPLARALRAGTTPRPAGWDVKRARLSAAFDRLEGAGYTIRSAYAAVRDPIRHRFAYQEDQYRGADLLGLGVASFSYLGGVHQQNVATLGGYVARVRADHRPLQRAYALDDAERLVREFVLQLKLGRAPADHFRRRFGVDVTEVFAQPLRPLVAEGLLVTDASGVTLTRAGLLQADHLIRAFFRPDHQVDRYN
jgi:oxygen-independent coproporphyrinogen-3 oxidase